MRAAVEKCSAQYGFDMTEALERLGMEVSISLSGKKTSSKKSVQAKPTIPLPFDGCVNASLCLGLKQNHGLYTQCAVSRLSGGEFCKSCQEQCSKNESGKPSNGTFDDRMKSDFRGPKGDAPKHYTSVMKKLKLTREKVLEEASKFNIEVAEEHFTAPGAHTKRGRPKKSSSESDESTDGTKKRGRPKKAAKDVKSEGVEDLFASLVSSAEQESCSDTSSISGSEDDGESSKETESDKKAAAKAEKKAAAEAEKQQKKAAAEAEKAEKKAAAEAEKQQKKAAAEAEKAEKKASAEALKQEKAEKKAASDAEKAAKKKEIATKKEAVSAPEVLKVKKFEYKGTKYLKSAAGVVYNLEQDEVGVFNEETKEIDFKAVESEAEESDYESDSDE
jgi:hypothetical protein